MKFRLTFLCVLLGTSTAFGAQTSDSANQNEQIQTLIARIAQLEKRVVELEASRGPGTPVPSALVPTAAPTQPSQAVAIPAAMPGMEATVPQATYPSLHISGFSDINFSASNLRGTRSGFNEGQFVLHFASALSPRVTYMGELSLSARADAGTGTPPAAGFNAEVERSIIRFEKNDYFKVSFGRYHTPINYWNTAFHHGQWLQTSVNRPEMTQFGGSFIPVHFIGALVEGSVPASGLNLNYNLGVGNGRGSVISRGGDPGDINNNRAWLINLYTKPDRFYGLQVGGSVYHDKVTQSSGLEFREWIESGHIVWQKENPEIIAEFANVTHEALASSIRSNSQAWYIQTAYRLPFREKQWKPYYRFEYIHIPKSDAVFRLVPSLAGSVLGMRYDLSGFAAIKFEYRNQRRPGQPRVHSLFMQTSFTF